MAIYSTTNFKTLQVGAQSLLKGPLSLFIDKSRDTCNILKVPSMGTARKKVKCKKN